MKEIDLKDIMNRYGMIFLNFICLRLTFLSGYDILIFLRLVPLIIISGYDVLICVNSFHYLIQAVPCISTV
jgi:hypothetical protein